MQLLTQLLYCLAHMLRQSYPCPVPLPGQAVLALASSVLTIQPAGRATLSCRLRPLQRMTTRWAIASNTWQPVVSYIVMHQDGAQLLHACKVAQYLACMCRKSVADDCLQAAMRCL